MPVLDSFRRGWMLVRVERVVCCCLICCPLPLLLLLRVNVELMGLVRLVSPSLIESVDLRNLGAAGVRAVTMWLVFHGRHLPQSRWIAT